MSGLPDTGVAPNRHNTDGWGGRVVAKKPGGTCPEVAGASFAKALEYLEYCQASFSVEKAKRAGEIGRFRRLLKPSTQLALRTSR